VCSRDAERNEQMLGPGLDRDEDRDERPTDSPKVPSALKEASPASSARVKLWSG
jgi:hypothetical protein